MSAKNQTTRIWDKVSITDPAITRRVSYGKRTYTAIDAQHQIYQATTLWGPMGSTWGVRSSKYDYVRDASGNPIELYFECEFFYPDGSFEISTDIRYSPGNDCRKKVRTDAITKALSQLGFNADVFMGKFDDNKYVHQVGEQFSKKTTYITRDQKVEIWNLIDNAMIPEYVKDNIREEMGNFSEERANNCITYLEQNQGDVVRDNGGRASMKDLGKSLERAVADEKS